MSKTAAREHKLTTKTETATRSITIDVRRLAMHSAVHHTHVEWRHGEALHEVRIKQVAYETIYSSRTGDVKAFLAGEGVVFGGHE